MTGGTTESRAESGECPRSEHADIPREANRLLRSVATPPRVDGPRQSEWDGAIHLRLSFSRDAISIPSKRRSPTAPWSNSIRPRRRKCSACERFFIARTSERSSARRLGQGSKASVKNGARRLRTMSFAITGSTSRSLWRTRSRPPSRCRSVRATFAKDKPNVETDLKADVDPDVVATTFGMRHRLDSQRGDAKGASRPRRSRSTKPMSRRPKRITPSSCTRRLRSGMDRH